MKKWGNFLLCLLVSAGIWLIHNLSQSYSELVSRQVVAASNLEGRSSRAAEDVTVSARINASGFHLLKLDMTKSKPVTINVKPEDLHQDDSDGNTFRISGNSLVKYSEQIFGNGISVESYVSEDIAFRFAAENHKKVPVKAVQVVSFAPQYMARKEISVSPDSVTIYGEPSVLKNIESVLTKQITLSEVRRNMHGTAKIEVPSGVRVSDREVSYSLEVSRFVELSSDVKLSVRNVPVDVNFTILPSSASVVFRCIFPVRSNPFSSSEFYIDYRDFEKSVTGKCLIMADNVPPGVIDFSVTPQVCECLITAAE